MKEIIQQYDSICWYPSAGSNIEAINFWEMNLGNTSIPKLYIFTDIAYTFTEQDILIGNKSINLPPEFEILEFNMNAGFERTLTDSEIELIKEKKINEHIKDDPTKRKDIEALAELGLIDLEINETEMALYALVKTPKASILFIRSNNVDLFNFYVASHTKLDYLLLNRHNDENFFITEFESTIIPALAIKEGLLNNNLTRLPETQLNRTNFNWTSTYNEHHKDLITYCNYQR